MPFQYKRFTESISEHLDPKTRDKVMNGLAPYESLNTPVQTTLWIKQMVDQLTAEAGITVAKEVMEACGQRCIGQSVLLKAKTFQAGSRDIDELLGKLNEAHLGGGHLYRVGNEIHASYDRCYCGSVSKTRRPISKIYCQCSCGWYKKFFETIFEKPVKVDLLDSIINGAKSCQFIIQI